MKDQLKEYEELEERETDEGASWYFLSCLLLLLL